MSSSSAFSGTLTLCHNHRTFFVFFFDSFLF